MFTPTTSKYENARCSGLRFTITERSKFNPTELGVHLAYELRRLHPSAWNLEPYNRLLANPEIFELVRPAPGPAQCPARLALDWSEARLLRTARGGPRTSPDPGYAIRGAARPST